MLWIMNLLHTLHRTACLSFLLSCPTIASAQCVNEWRTDMNMADGSASALVAMPNGDVVAGGNFVFAGNARIGRWDGTSWTGLGGGMNSSVLSLVVMPNGDLIAGGRFTIAGGTNANRIARWDGTSWSPLGTGFSGNFDYVRTLQVMPNGDLIAGGSFASAGGVSANNIARWDGSSWSALDVGMNNIVLATTLDANGDLIAGGQFTTASGVAVSRVARFDGTSWVAMGTGSGALVAGSVQALLRRPNGNVIASGFLTSAGGVATNHVAQWDGSSWSSLGADMNNTALSLTTLPNGDLAVGGAFTMVGGNPSGSVVRWDGSNWTDMGFGSPADPVVDLVTMPNGDVIGCGSFTIPMGVEYAALLRSTCPATATTVGTGCFGSGGLNELAADSLPWIGTTFTATATGLPSLAFAMLLTGFGTVSVPLAAILPAGVPGCDLLVTADVVEVALPSAGMVQTQLALPNNASLVGAVLHRQVVPIEVNATLNFLAITSTNALTLTVGVF